MTITDTYLADVDSSTFDLEAYVLERVDPRLLESTEGRRELTRIDPLLFAILYTPHLIKGDGSISFADLHLALCRHARRWLRRPLPREERHAMVAPRESGKSSWMFKILPLWAAAHGHLKFVAAFSSSATQAEGHVAAVRREMDANALLRQDYPELCAPARRPNGAPVADSRQMLYTSSGFSFAARGLDSEVLGLVNADNLRPDLIILDDVEPDESNYTPYQAKKRLTTIVDTVLPMAETAHVVLVGTVTMPGSIVHQLVKTVTTTEKPADWISEERWQVHYFEPIVKTADGRERSIWPAKWPLAYLHTISHTRSFKKNFLNQPVAVDGDYWSEADFRYGDVNASKVLLQIDPAVTTTRTSDFYGLAVVAYEGRSGLDGVVDFKLEQRGAKPSPRCAVRYARAFRMTPERLREKVLELLTVFPAIGAVRIEVNQGGETWRSVLHNLPVRLLVHTESAPKAVRATWLLNDYQRGRVLHAEPLPEAEEQMCAFPHVHHDDLIDAVGAGVRYFLAPKKKASATTTNYTRGAA